MVATFNKNAGIVLQELNRNSLLRNRFRAIHLMSDELTPEELNELILHGRINATPSKKRRTQNVRVERPVRKQQEVPKAGPKTKEPDAEWLKLQAEKAEKNIAAPSHDLRRKDERQEASKF
jgi:hypothetical protein